MSKEQKTGKRILFVDMYIVLRVFAAVLMRPGSRQLLQQLNKMLQEMPLDLKKQPNQSLFYLLVGARVLGLRLEQVKEAYITPRTYSSWLSKADQARLLPILCAKILKGPMNSVIAFFPTVIDSALQRLQEFEKALYNVSKTVRNRNMLITYKPQIDDHFVPAAKQAIRNVPLGEAWHTGFKSIVGELKARSELQALSILQLMVVFFGSVIERMTEMGVQQEVKLAPVQREVKPAPVMAVVPVAPAPVRREVTQAPVVPVAPAPVQREVTQAPVVPAEKAAASLAVVTPVPKEDKEEEVAENPYKIAQTLILAYINLRLNEAVESGFEDKHRNKRVCGIPVGFSSGTKLAAAFSLLNFFMRKTFGLVRTPVRLHPALLQRGSRLAGVVDKVRPLVTVVSPGQWM